VRKQTGRSFARIKNRKDLNTYDGPRLYSAYFLIDDQKTLWKKKLFRKLRLFCIHGEFFPVVCHLDKTRNVHGANRITMMRVDEALLAEEKRFL
jgi:hypothetical protein